jgi:hypothetical protein
MKKFLTTLAVLTACATPAFAQSFDPDNGTGNVLSFAHTPTAPHDQKLRSDRASYTFSPWFRHPARFSIRKAQKIRAVAASATTKCSVSSEPAKNKEGCFGLLSLSLFVCRKIRAFYAV